MSFRNWLMMVVLVLAVSVQAGAPKVGDLFPDMNSVGLEGDVPETDGRVVLVDFWASWCGPCKASFPILDDLQKKYVDQGFILIGISVDEKASKMEDFLKKHPVSFPTVRDADHKLVSTVQVKTMPTSFLLDREGRILKIHSGFRGEKTRKKLEAEIVEALK